MTDKPSVLFVCVHNAGRSQMAAGFLTHLAGDRIEVRSAGSTPADAVNPIAGCAKHGSSRNPRKTRGERMWSNANDLSGTQQPAARDHRPPV